MENYKLDSWKTAAGELKKLVNDWELKRDKQWLWKGGGNGKKEEQTSCFKKVKMGKGNWKEVDRYWAYFKRTKKQEKNPYQQ